MYCGSKSLVTDLFGNEVCPKCHPVLEAYPDLIGHLQCPDCGVQLYVDMYRHNVITLICAECSHVYFDHYGVYKPCGEFWGVSTRTDKQRLAIKKKLIRLVKTGKLHEKEGDQS